VSQDDGRGRFAGRVCVVTGGGSGLGEAMSLGFAREGGRVAVLDIHEQAAQKVADVCDEDARAYACDVADPAAVRSVFDAIASDLGPVDVLVNNAGIAVRRQEVQDRIVEGFEAALGGGEPKPIRATSTLADGDWDRVLRVHLYGTFHCTREALRSMEDRRSGVILNITSMAAIRGLPGSPEYTAAKGGILSLTKGLAQEVAAAGIRVNAIAPGWIRTPLTSEEIDPRLEQIMLAQVPFGRMGEPDDVAALALHLCSDEASYTSGQVISPNGAMTY
jgi:3-oxoacyl-[acyl-carrier protein] reductase